jgi:hypothetical protein
MVPDMLFARVVVRKGIIKSLEDMKNGVGIVTCIECFYPGRTFRFLEFPQVKYLKTYALQSYSL